MSDVSDLDAMVDDLIKNRVPVEAMQCRVAISDLRTFAARVALAEAMRSRPDCGRFIGKFLADHVGPWGCRWCDRIAELRRLAGVEARGDD